jgi:hypothetical protein
LLPLFLNTSKKAIKYFCVICLFIPSFWLFPQTSWLADFNVMNFLLHFFHIHHNNLWPCYGLYCDRICMRMMVWIQYKGPSVSMTLEFYHLRFAAGVFTTLQFVILDRLVFWLNGCYTGVQKWGVNVFDSVVFCSSLVLSPRFPHPQPSLLHWTITYTYKYLKP